MATLEVRRGIYFVRFRYRHGSSRLSQEYKRSLKTRNRRQAETAPSGWSQAKCLNSYVVTPTVY